MKSNYCNKSLYTISNIEDKNYSIIQKKKMNEVKSFEKNNDCEKNNPIYQVDEIIRKNNDNYFQQIISVPMSPFDNIKEIKNENPKKVCFMNQEFIDHYDSSNNSDFKNKENHYKSVQESYINDYKIGHSNDQNKESHSIFKANSLKMLERLKKKKSEIIKNIKLMNNKKAINGMKSINKQNKGKKTTNFSLKNPAATKYSKQNKSVNMDLDISNNRSNTPNLIFKNKKIGESDRQYESSFSIGFYSKNINKNRELKVIKSIKKNIRNEEKIKC